MFLLIGWSCGVLFVFYSICFRWRIIRGTYGRYDLNFWASYIWAFGLVGLFLDLLVFAFGYSAE